MRLRMLAAPPVLGILLGSAALWVPAARADTVTALWCQPSERTGTNAELRIEIRGDTATVNSGGTRILAPVRRGATAYFLAMPNGGSMRIQGQGATTWKSSWPRFERSYTCSNSPQSLPSGGGGSIGGQAGLSASSAPGGAGGMIGAGDMGGSQLSGLSSGLGGGASVQMGSSGGLGTTMGGSMGGSGTSSFGGGASGSSGFRGASLGGGAGGGFGSSGSAMSGGSGSGSSSATGFGSAAASGMGGGSGGSSSNGAFSARSGQGGTLGGASAGQDGSGTAGTSIGLGASNDDASQNPVLPGAQVPLGGQAVDLAGPLDPFNTSGSSLTTGQSFIPSRAGFGPSGSSSLAPYPGTAPPGGPYGDPYQGQYSLGPYPGSSWGPAATQSSGQSQGQVPANASRTRY